MKATVSLFLLLVISTLVAGRSFQQHDPGSSLYDTDYPVDDEIDNDYQGGESFAEQDFDFPDLAGNDYGSGYWIQVNYIFETCLEQTAPTLYKALLFL